MIEHWDDLSITVTFDVKEYHVEFRAVEITATDIVDDGGKWDRGWPKNGGDGPLDLVFDPAAAERFIEGFVKWDGCSEVSFDSSMHLCGKDDINRLADGMKRIHTRCGELLGDKALEGAFK